MNCVITGGAGFIGGHLARRLLRDGHDITILDNLKRVGSLFGELQHDHMRLLVGDIRDDNTVREAVAGAEVIFHLAAQAQVMASENDHDYAFSTNVGGTITVLQAAVAAGVRRLVFTSSREVYGEAVRLPVPETAALIPKNLYGASKVAGEAYCHALGNSGGLSTCVLRLANVYGPGDRDRLVPIFVARALAGEPLELYGGAQVLDLIQVEVVVEALVRAASLAPTPLPINVGSGQGRTIRDVAARVLQATGSSVRLVVRPPRSIEVERYTADVSRMQAILALSPPHDPLNGIDTLVRAARDERHLT